MDRGGKSAPPPTLTFLIADVRGYTSFTRERGDAAAAQLARKFADLARDAVEARSGRVLELRGDEALAVFNSSAQAVRAAVDLQATFAEESRADPAFQLPVGIGIDTGEAIPVEEGYRGAALNMAARLCSSAGAGQIVVTRSVVDLSADVDEVTFTDRGHATFKGFEEPVRVLEVLGDVSPVTPSTLGESSPEGARDAIEPLPPELDQLSPLVDRESEMRWLRGTWRQVQRGRGRLVFASGPAQIGKTRLGAEIAHLIRERGGSVRYVGPGGAATALALGTVRDVMGAQTPTLLVLDDVDVAGPQVAQAVGSSLEQIAHLRVMVFALLRDHEASPELAELVERADERGDGHRVLSPLDREGVRGIVRLYVGEDEADAPVEAMARASNGVPGRVHEVVSDWARSEASRRLAAAAEFLAAGRDRHASDLEFANNVIGLKLGRLFRVEGGDALSGESCPYKGLVQFEENDSASFFGRERLIGELAARTVQAGLLGVVGVSGSGKSSVIAAGLLPSLRAGLLPGSERWTFARMRPGEHPMDELRRCLSTDTDDPLEAAIGGLPSAGRLIVAIDQFEEVFTTCASEEERAAFIGVLTRGAARWPGRVAAVVAIRGDHYASCAPYPELADALARNHVLVGPLSRDELRRAIELPARRAGLRVESALADALAEEVAEEPGGLPLLSTALVELWRARESGWIRMEAYERTGGVRGAVARLAESSFEQLSSIEREAARRVFLRLVATGEGEAVTRRRVPVEEFDLDTNVAAADVLTRLTEDRLLTVGDGNVEVAHEALLREWPRLQGWLDEDSQGRLLRQHLTQASRQWQGGGRQTYELYRGARLSAALDWSSEHAEELNQLERGFLAASRQASEEESERQRRTNRRLRGLVAGVAAFLVIALVAGSLALVQRGRARRSATIADAQRLGVEALVADDLDLSMLLARQGLALDDSLATRSNLQSVVAKWNPAIGVIDPNLGPLLGYGGMDLSADGRFLVATSGRLRSNATVIDTTTGRIVRRFEADPFFPPSFGRSNTLLVVPPGSSGVEGQDPLTGTAEWTVHLPRRAEFCCTMNLRPDGQMLAINLYTWYRMIDTSTMSARTIRAPEGTGFRDVTFTPDGRGLVEVRDLVELQDDRWNIYVTSRRTLPGLKLQDRSAPTLVDWRSNQNDGWSPDGRWVWTGNFDNTIHMYNMVTGAHRVLRTADLPIREALSPDGKILVAGSHDDTLSVWRVLDGVLLETLAGHTGWPNSGIRFSPDGRTLYTGGQDGRILIWDLEGDRRIGRPLTGMVEPTCDLTNNFAISPEGAIVAAAHTPIDDCLNEAAGWVSLYNAPTQGLRERFPAFASSVAFSPDGRTLATAGRKGGVRLWDVASGAPIGLPSGGGVAAAALPTIRVLAFSPDGAILVAGGDDGKVYFVDALSGATLGDPLPMPVRIVGQPTDAEGQPPDQGVKALAFSPDGTELATSAGRTDPASPVGSSVVVWRMSDRSQVTTLPLSDRLGFVGALAFSPDGRLLATGQGDGRLRFWDARTWREVGDGVSASTDEILSIDFDLSGTTVVTAGFDSSVRLFDTSTHEEIGRAFPRFTGPGSAAFAPDGRRIVMGNFSNAVFEWNVDPSAWAQHACEVAGRNLTSEEWRRFLPGRQYQSVCG